MTGTVHEDLWQFIIPLSVLLRMRNVWKIETYILFSVTFFSKIVPFMRESGKYSRTKQATDDTMAHAHCMLDTKGYKLTYLLTSLLTYLLTYSIEQSPS